MDVLDGNSCTINSQSAEPTDSGNVASTPIDSLSTINFDKSITCRLCLSTNGNYSHFLGLFDLVSTEHSIADIIAKHFWFIKPSSDDLFSKNICKTCWQIVQAFHAYYIQVYETQHNFYGKESLCAASIKVELSEQAEGDNRRKSNFGQQLTNVMRKGKPKKRKKPKQKVVSNSRSSEIEMKFAKPTRVNTLKPLLMPKTFDDQVQTDDIFKRFKKIRPFLADETNNMFNCNFCSKSFNIRSSARTHMERHHPLPFVCPEGDARYETMQEALDHIKEAHTSDHHDSTVCSVCGKVLSSVCSLKSHMESVHRPADQPKVQCKECGTWLADLKILAIHHSRQHINMTKPMKCDQCFRILSSEKRLAHHKRRYHENSLTKHKCTICEKEFHFKLRLREHISSVHAGEALYKCDFCAKTFNVRSNFYTHRRRMHPEEHQKILDKRAADRVIRN